MTLFVAACSSPAASTGGNGDDGGTEQSEPAEASQDDGGGGGDSGGGGGGGGGGGDADQAFERLTPPNADELTKTEAGGVIFAAFDTSDSIDSLTSFYEDAFSDLGLQIISTTETGGGISWIFGNDDTASTFGGAISVFPASDGSGTQVSVQVGTTE
jgi:hypothetical protein